MRSAIANRNNDVDFAGPSGWHLLPQGVDPIIGPKIFRVLRIFLNGEM